MRILGEALQRLYLNVQEEVRMGETTLSKAAQSPVSVRASEGTVVENGGRGYLGDEAWGPPTKSPQAPGGGAGGRGRGVGGSSSSPTSSPPSDYKSWDGGASSGGSCSTAPTNPRLQGWRGVSLCLVTVIR